MGWGDYLMTSGHIRNLKKQNPKLQILIKKPYYQNVFYQGIFLNNPYVTNHELLDTKKPFLQLSPVKAGQKEKDGKYIIWSKENVAQIGDFFPQDFEMHNAEMFYEKALKDWKIKNRKNPKGTIFIANYPKKEAIINNVKVQYDHAENRDWGPKNWKNFFKKTSGDYLLINTSDTHQESISEWVYTYKCNYREAYSLMLKCDIFLGNEGGLAHLWAVTKKKAIVLFGHWISPLVTGYSFHINLTVNKNNHCGSLTKCDLCRKFFDELEYEYVKYLIEKNL